MSENILTAVRDAPPGANPRPQTLNIPRRKDGAANPGLLKLALFCKGIRIHPSCGLDENNARPVLRTRAGLGSGLEAKLAPDLYLNIPVEEEFAKHSPFELIRENGKFYVRQNDEILSEIFLPPKPDFYDRLTSSGAPMSRIGVLQGTYLGVYVGSPCFFWGSNPMVNCRFCSTGLNVGTIEEEDKKIRDVVETALAAREDEKITYVHLNTGFLMGKELDVLEPYVKALKKETGLMVGVQTIPTKELHRYDKLKEAGVENVSFCFEVFDPECFKEVCPGKEKYVGLDTYLNAITYCAKKFPAVNGEIIAGLEPVESTLRAIDWITGQGAQPTVCVFRPCVDTDYQNVPPPAYEDMLPVFARQYTACIEKGVPIGIAPNIKVSLVILPEEGKYFVEDGKLQFSFKLNEFKNHALKAAARTYFALRLAFH